MIHLGRTMRVVKLAYGGIPLADHVPEGVIGHAFLTLRCQRISGTIHFRSPRPEVIFGPLESLRAPEETALKDMGVRIDHPGDHDLTILRACRRSDTGNHPLSIDGQSDTLMPAVWQKGPSRRYRPDCVRV
jgi:hypothetical protein